MSSAVAAYQALIDLNPLSQYRLTEIATTTQLEQLWAIDKEAYGDCSIEFQIFENWWRQYPPGLKAITCKGEIIAAFGLFPLSQNQAAAFERGEVRESELIPVSQIELRRSPVHHWYFSGVVLCPVLRKTKDSPLRLLLSSGISLWLSSGQIAYPASLLALAYSPEGQKMLERFSFVQLSKSDLPDGCPLYKLDTSTKKVLTNILKRRLAL